MNETEEEIARKGPKIFGRYLADIPCFRDSYIYGIWTGIGAGLACFMFTSRPRIASHFGFSSFIVTTLSYWTYCRIRWDADEKNAQMLQELMKEHIAREGLTPKNSVMEPEIVTVSNA